MGHNSLHSILYGNIQIPTSHVSPYAVDESVLLYEPLPEDIVKDDNRTIFNNVPITPNEENILEDFLKYICNDYLVKNKSKCQEIIEWLYIMEPEFLRFLYSAGFDYKKTLECIFMNYQFRKSNMLPAMLDDIEEELNDGYMYWFGRDKKFRPTLVADVFKLQNLSMDKLVKLVVFCFEFFLRYLHVGGKSENYNVLIDCNNRGVVQLPVQMIIQLTEIMHSKYRGRLNNLFLVNSPNLINVILKPLKGVLSDRVLKKIVILKQDSRDDLLLLYDPNQLQQRFGGYLPDLTSHYYPFHFFPNSYRFNTIDKNNTKIYNTDLSTDGGDIYYSEEEDVNNDKEKTKDEDNKDKEKDRDMYIEQQNEKLEIDEDYLVKNHSLLRIPPSVLYGRCMILNKYLSDYLCKLIKPKLNEDDNNNKDNDAESSNESDEFNVNYCNHNINKYRNKWFKNIRYYILSREAGNCLIDKLPEMKEEIEFSIIKSREDLIRFIDKLN